MTKIVGIGNALVDVIVSLPNEALLERFNLKKGGMEMIEQERKRAIHEQIKDLKQVVVSGGSTSNTIHGLARLGVTAGYIGKISKDKAGEFFRKELNESNITEHLIYSDMDTGIATTLMTEDAERTFATYLGAAAAMHPDEIVPELLQDYKYILVEGYLIFNRELITKVCRLAKEKGLKIAMDMASYNLVETNREFIRELLENYVDIIFANEEEAFAFTGKHEEAALEELANYCEVAVIKLGAQGSIADIRGDVVKIPAYKARCIDTNGAGDIYAAGFLYGLIHNLPGDEIGKLASRLSGELVQTVGAKLSNEQWKKILPELGL